MKLIHLVGKEED